MKYLVAALTLIFSMSGTVNADDNNTRWILLISETILDVKMPKTFLRNRNVNFQTEHECYEGLKELALRQKKENPNQFIKDMKINIIDDVKISAIASDDFLLVQIHCLEIISD